MLQTVSCTRLKRRGCRRFLLPAYPLVSYPCGPNSCRIGLQPVQDSAGQVANLSYCRLGFQPVQDSAGQVGNLSYSRGQGGLVSWMPRKLLPVPVPPRDCLAGSRRSSALLGRPRWWRGNQRIRLAGTGHQACQAGGQLRRGSRGHDGNVSQPFRGDQRRLVGLWRRLTAGTRCSQTGNPSCTPIPARAITRPN